MPEVRTTSSTGGQKGVKLARFELIPAGPLKELAEHYGRGARKYASHQWRQGYEWGKSIGALYRHLNDFVAGKDYDVCSNEPDNCSHVYPDGYKDPEGNDLSGQPYSSGEPDTCFNHTGSHHMAAVAWHAFLLLEFKDVHKNHDDRYVPPPTLEEYAQILDDFDVKFNYVAVAPPYLMDPEMPTITATPKGFIIEPGEETP